MRLCVGATGHRRSHVSYPADDADLLATLSTIFSLIDHLAKDAGADAPVRLSTLLADGTDEAAANAGQSLDWALCVPLPLGRLLNRAIAAQPLSPAETERILAGGHPEEPKIATRLRDLESIEESGSLFEIAEQDAALADLLRRYVAEPADRDVAQRFAFETGRRYALGARVVIEQSDVIVAVWDGQSTANLGGTGDTVREALRAAVPVVHIDPARPQDWSILTSTEMLACPAHGDIRGEREKILRNIAMQALGRGLEPGLETFSTEPWRASSAWRHHPFRRVESLFGSRGLAARFSVMRRHYEPPGAIEAGSAAPLLARLSGIDPDANRMAQRIGQQILRRFAWADGIATHLSDRYRSGMVVNFLLGSVAIVAGVLYLPLGGPENKWIFASIELVTLLVIVANTQLGKRRDLHARWFTMRRAAEYLRQRPLMVAAGVARPAGQWPSGESGGWPELLARMTVRSVGLPTATITETYLRHLLETLLDMQVLPQKAYHAAKSAHLNRVHHALDKTSEGLFLGAIAMVALYLLLAGLQAAGWAPGLDVKAFGKWATVAGVAFPTVGGALAGIRYFGDFERFAEISQVASQRLGDPEQRIRHLSEAAPGRLEFGEVADLLRATDDIVFDELESWQAVFSGKRIAVPA